MWYVIRNRNKYGPYSIDDLVQYVESGKLLKCDTAFDENDSANIQSVGYFLRQTGKKIKVQTAGSLRKQFAAIGRELILPKNILSKRHWQADKRLMVIALVGLTPLMLLFPVTLVGNLYLTFYIVSLYFAAIWGAFFYYLFKTTQVQLKETIAVFFIQQLFIFLFFGLGINTYINPFYWIGGDSFFPLSLVFYIFAVGLTEEFSKQIPLFLILRRTKEPLVPQTLVFYGLISGIAFGVYEGVQYQTTLNMEMEYSQSFYLNIARLTSLPFLHAIWTGIGAYFLSFAKIYPKYRLSLYILAIGIPALLHGLYDGLPLGNMAVTIISVLLLMIYLKQGLNMQSKLKN